MKQDIKKSLVIALTLGILSSVTLNVMLATYFVKEGLYGTQMVLTGLDAVEASIRDFGVMSFVRLIVGYFIVFFIPVFIGCVWLMKWQDRRDGQEAT